MESKKNSLIQIQNIKFELKNKLKQIEKEIASVTRATTSFGWLAALVIFLFFLIFILNDFQKNFLYLKKKNLLNFKRIFNLKKIQNREVYDLNDKSLSIFKQVSEKDKNIFNHSYFQKTIKYEFKIKKTENTSF